MSVKNTEDRVKDQQSQMLGILIEIQRPGR